MQLVILIIVLACLFVGGFFGFVSGVTKGINLKLEGFHCTATEYEGTSPNRKEVCTQWTRGEK